MSCYWLCEKSNVIERTGYRLCICITSTSYNVIVSHRHVSIGWLQGLVVVSGNCSVRMRWTRGRWQHRWRSGNANVAYSSYARSSNNRGSRCSHVCRSCSRCWTVRLGRLYSSLLTDSRPGVDYKSPVLMPTNFVLQFRFHPHKCDFTSSYNSN